MQDIFDDEPKEMQIVDYSIGIWDDNRYNVEKDPLHIRQLRYIDSNIIRHAPSVHNYRNEQKIIVFLMNKQKEEEEVWKVALVTRTWMKYVRQKEDESPIATNLP